MLNTIGFDAAVKMGDGYVSEGQWRDILTRAFPLRVSCIFVKDEKENRRGADWILEGTQGTFLKIQTKAQSPRYDDFVIEFLANDKTNTPGWVNTEMHVDWIAYAIPLRNKVFFIAWPLLQAAWKKNGLQWLRKAEAKEEGYRMARVRQTWGGETHSVVVPVAELQRELEGSIWSVPIVEEKE